MTTVSVAATKNPLSELIALAEASETVCVTRRGKLVARLEATRPPEAVRAQRLEVRKAFDARRLLSNDVQLEGELKAMAGEGAD